MLILFLLASVLIIFLTYKKYSTQERVFIIDPDTGKKIFGIPYESVFFTDTTGKVETPCPNHNKAITFITLGQSHASNSHEKIVGSNGNKNIVNFWRGNCYLLSDPLLGATEEKGSIWTLFAQNYYEKVKVPIVMMSFAVSGSSSQQWMPDDGAELMNNLLNGITQYINQGRKIDYIVYFQGETDAFLKSDKKSFINRLETIFDFLQNYLPGEQKFLIFASSYCYPYNGASIAITQGQIELAEKRPDTELVFNTDTLNGFYRYDGCHFNQLGTEVIVKNLLKKMQDIEREKKPQ